MASGQMRALLEYSAIAPALYAAWKLPDWAQQWLDFARDLREFRAGPVIPDNAGLRLTDAERRAVRWSRHRR